ncbi:MAG: chorismate mutase [Clostridia bacterium]|nr:chorismate mutase [Clostridia bacterium]
MQDRLSEARAIINEVDKEMAALFRRRMEAAKMVGEYKMARGLPVLDEKREDELVRRNLEYLSESEEDVRAGYACFLRSTMAISRHYQQKMMTGLRVAFSGTEGAFASIAAGRLFPDATRVPFGDFTSAYNAVVAGECDLAVLPLENSSAGEVGAVTDLLFSGPLYVNRVYDLSVTHDLLTLPGVRIDEIKRVISHPQALGQCADYIRAHGFETVEYSNTARAAERVAELGDRSTAAIASEEAASIYGLEIAARAINGEANNTTRFAVLSSARNVPSGNRSDLRFILTFTVRNEAGSLARAIDVIGKHGYNMLSLRSRPMKELLWQYYFYVEAEGNIDTQRGADMVAALAEYCDNLRVVGSYIKDN